MRIVFDRRALLDIEHIHQWISRSSPRMANKVVARIYVSIEGLTAFPAIGRLSADPRLRECIVSKTPYLIINQVRPASSEIVIRSILHQAQDRSL
jgi:plasmid stabilization system protein ParE